MKKPVEYIQEPIWLCVGKLMDGSLSPPMANAHIVFDREVIYYVGPDAPPPDAVKPGQAQPDAVLPDAVLLPGLIDGHTHIFLEGGELDFEKRKAHQAQSAEALLVQARVRLKKVVQTGVIAMRDGGDKDGVGLGLRAECNGGLPRITSPGAAIHRKGRYGSFIGRPLEDHGTPEACVADRISRGADHIKIVPTGIINFQKGQVTQPPQMDAEDVRALVAAAKAHGKSVMAHASGAPGVEQAIQGCVDTVEHGFFITDEQLARMRDLDMAWVPTFVPVQVQVDQAEKMGWNAKVVAHLQRILDDHAARLRRADAMGMTLIAGSDAGSCGVPHGLGLLDEMALMERAGLSALKVIHAATGACAARFEFGQKIGLLKAGYRPWMMLTEWDPAQTVANLKKEKWLFFEGQWHGSDGDASGL